jgi:hypothetical protein
LRFDALKINNLLADAEASARLEGAEFQFYACHPLCFAGEIYAVQSALERSRMNFMSMMVQQTAMTIVDASQI